MKQLNEKTILVVAPNLVQFEVHAAEKASVCKGYHRGPGWVSCDGTKYKFISAPDKMRGYRADSVEYWGTWYDMPAGVIEEFKIIENMILNK